MTVLSKPTNPSSTATQTKRKILPPIPLERPAKQDLPKGAYQSYKLRNIPDDPMSPTYELSVPYLSSGTPEEWLLFKKNVNRVITGQDKTTGPPKYVLARRLLQGEALATFDNKATELGNETVAHFKECPTAVTNFIFPVRSSMLQKRYMRRFLRKPAEMTTREYVARVPELNNYLPEFPQVNGNDVDVIPPEKIRDMLEFGVPASWQ